MSRTVGDYISILTGGWWRDSDVEVPTAPAAPTLAVANDGNGTSATATVAGDAGVTHRLYYRAPGMATWTLAGTRSGDGTISVTGLVSGSYQFVAVSSNAGVYSTPSSLVSVAVASDEGGLFSRVAAAHWAIVQADATCAALLARGTKYRLVSGDLLRKLEYEAAWCPILAIAPDDSGHAWPPARRRRGEGLERRFALRVAGATAGQDYDAMLTLWEAYSAAVAADLRTGDILTALDVVDVEFDNVQFLASPNANSVIETWRWEATLIHRFRLG